VTEDYDDLRENGIQVKVNEVINLGGIDYKCIKGNEGECISKCAFSSLSSDIVPPDENFCHMLNCMSDLREDGQDVIFVKAGR
jgi:hypothetical protein